MRTHLCRLFQEFGHGIMIQRDGCIHMTYARIGYSVSPGSSVARNKAMGTQETKSAIDTCGLTSAFSWVGGIADTEPSADLDSFEPVKVMLSARRRAESSPISILAVCRQAAWYCFG